MSLTLRPVTWENFSAVIALTVTPAQAEFVAPNVRSIAEAYLEPTWTSLAIYAGDNLVGFAMFGRDGETGHWWIMRYMIDAQHQGRGYGTAALRVLIDLMVERHNCGEIFLDYSPATTSPSGSTRGLDSRRPVRLRRARSWLGSISSTGTEYSIVSIEYARSPRPDCGNHEWRP
jgi:diamine N-acetyltransferase